MNADQSAKTYVRRRAFNKIHVTSWLIYLEKDGYVRCSFQNCNFMAFDVEEMCNHFGYCKGDSSSAKFECGFCKGRTDSSEKLQLHLSQAHNVGPSTSKDIKVAPIEPDPTGHGKPSKVLLVSWTCFFDKNNYVKCQACNYIANAIQDMCRHYKVCKQEIAELLYVCPVCKGRTLNVNPLLWHMEKSHKIFKTPSQFNHISKDMINYWKKELDEKKYVCCLHIQSGKRDCSYFDLDVVGIIEHAQCCKGPQLHNRKEQCPCCAKWTNSEEKLQHHIDISHPNDSQVYKNTSICENLDNDLLQVKFKLSKQPPMLLEIGSKDFNVHKSSKLPEENKAAKYSETSMQVYGEVSTLSPDDSNRNELIIHDNLLSDSDQEQFKKVVIPSSLFSISPDQENSRNIYVMSSKLPLNNHCQATATCKEELIQKPSKEFNSLVPDTDEDPQLTNETRDPIQIFIKEEVVSLSQESLLNQDVTIKNYNYANGNTEVIITKDSIVDGQEHMDQKCIPDKNSSGKFQESFVKGNQIFLFENSHDGLQDQVECVKAKEVNQKVNSICSDKMDEKRKRTCYALFQDDTSDEDDPSEPDDHIQSKILKCDVNEDAMSESNGTSCVHKLFEDGGNRTFSKNYLRRSKTVRSSESEVNVSSFTNEYILPHNFDGMMERCIWL